MKRLIGIAIAVALWLVSVPVAEAINITLAEVQNGVAVVQGNKAAKKAAISWETSNVGQTTNGGSFSFSGIVPADCVGQLSIGAETIDVTLANCAAPTPALAPVPQTGQTATFTAGDDGAIRAGVALPSPRFTDNSDGTITDNLTKLIWLKNADCPQTPRNWTTAMADVANLNTDGTMNGNDCGDTSNGGTHQTDWRLPNIRELFSLVHFAFSEPCLSNTAGTGKWVEGDPFTGFLPADPHPSTRWSSTANAFNPDLAWMVDFDGDSLVFDGIKTGGASFVTAVRGPLSAATNTAASPTPSTRAKKGK
jgi:hypothetical protein